MPGAFARAQAKPRGRNSNKDLTNMAVRNVRAVVLCRPHPKRRLLSCLPTIEFSGMRQRKLTGLDWLGSKIPLHYKSIKYIKVDVSPGFTAQVNTD